MNGEPTRKPWVPLTGRVHPICPAPRGLFIAFAIWIVGATLINLLVR